MDVRIDLNLELGGQTITLGELEEFARAARLAGLNEEDALGLNWDEKSGEVKGLYFLADSSIIRDAPDD